MRTMEGLNVVFEVMAGYRISLRDRETRRRENQSWCENYGVRRVLITYLKAAFAKKVLPHSFQ